MCRPNVDLPTSITGIHENRLHEQGFLVEGMAVQFERLAQNFWRLLDLSPGCGVGLVTSLARTALYVFECSRY